MKRFLFSFYATAILLNFGLVRAEDLEAFSGKWLAKKVNEQGEKYSQTLEIRKDKFIFQILGADEQVILHAEGGIKLEKAGPFSAVRFFHIRAGGSSSNLQEIENEYISIYVLDDESCTMASNFDKRCEQQKPSADVYRHIKSAVPAKPAKSA